VQTQLFVTCLPWCDFVLWAPGGDIHVEKIFYDQMFVEEAVSKARAFYFDKFLPSVVPYLIISQSFEPLTTAVDLTANNSLVKRATNAPEAFTESCDNVELL